MITITNKEDVILGKTYFINSLGFIGLVVPTSVDSTGLLFNCNILSGFWIRNWRGRTNEGYVKVWLDHFVYRVATDHINPETRHACQIARGEPI